MRGKIASGLGQGQYFLTREATAPLSGALWLRPFPWHPERAAGGARPCGAASDPDRGICRGWQELWQVQCYRIKLNGIEYAVVRPERSGRMARASLGAKKRHLPMVAGSDSHFAATVGLGVTKIEAADAEEAVAAIRAGHTRVVGKRTPPRFFIGNTVQSIYTIVRTRVRRGRTV